MCTGPFDILSAMMSGITFGLLIFGIDGIAHGHPGCMIAPSSAARRCWARCSCWRQKRLADPMMPVDIFKRPIFALSIAAATCTFTAQGLAFVSLPFFFHTVLGRNATDTGILLTAWPLALATRRADRRPPGRPLSRGRPGRDRPHQHDRRAGADGAAAARTRTVDIMWRLVLCGAGFGIFASPNNRLMMNAVPRERSGSAGGIIATARTLGQTMGAALVALMFGLFDFSGGGAADAAARRHLAGAPVSPAWPWSSAASG